MAKGKGKEQAKGEEKGKHDGKGKHEKGKHDDGFKGKNDGKGMHEHGIDDDDGLIEAVMIQQCGVRAFQEAKARGDIYSKVDNLGNEKWHYRTTGDSLFWGHMRARDYY